MIRAGTHFWARGTVPGLAPWGGGVNLKRHPPTTQFGSLCNIPQTFSVRLGLQVFMHGIVEVRNHRATLACSFLGELSQVMAWQGTSHSTTHATPP